MWEKGIEKCKELALQYDQEIMDYDKMSQNLVWKPFQYSSNTSCVNSIFIVLKSLLVGYFFSRVRYQLRFIYLLTNLNFTYIHQLLSY